VCTAKCSNNGKLNTAEDALPRNTYDHLFFSNVCTAKCSNKGKLNTAEDALPRNTYDHLFFSNVCTAKCSNNGKFNIAEDALPRNTYDHLFLRPPHIKQASQIVDAKIISPYRYYCWSLSLHFRLPTKMLCVTMYFGGVRDPYLHFSSLTL
jgi:hypothetical protein